MHQVSTNKRQNREEGTNNDLSIGAAIGLAGAAAAAAMCGCEVGSRTGKYCCDKISRWWNDDGRDDRRGNTTNGGH